MPLSPTSSPMTGDGPKNMISCRGSYYGDSLDHFRFTDVYRDHLLTPTESLSDLSDDSSQTEQDLPFPSVTYIDMSAPTLPNMDPHPASAYGTPPVVDEPSPHSTSDVSPINKVVNGVLYPLDAIYQLRSVDNISKPSLIYESASQCSTSQKDSRSTPTVSVETIPGTQALGDKPTAALQEIGTTDTTNRDDSTNPPHEYVSLVSPTSPLLQPTITQSRLPQNSKATEHSQALTYYDPRYPITPPPTPTDGSESRDNITAPHTPVHLLPFTLITERQVLKFTDSKVYTPSSHDAATSMENIVRTTKNTLQGSTASLDEVHDDAPPQRHDTSIGLAYINACGDQPNLSSGNLSKLLTVPVEHDSITIGGTSLPSLPSSAHASPTHGRDTSPGVSLPTEAGPQSFRSTERREGHSHSHKFETGTSVSPGRDFDLTRDTDPLREIDPPRINAQVTSEFLYPITPVSSSGSYTPDIEESKDVRGDVPQVDPTANTIVQVSHRLIIEVIIDLTVSQNDLAVVRTSPYNDNLPLDPTLANLNLPSSCPKNIDSESHDGVHPAYSIFPFSGVDLSDVTSQDYQSTEYSHHQVISPLSFPKPTSDSSNTHLTQFTTRASDPLNNIEMSAQLPNFPIEPHSIVNSKSPAPHHSQPSVTRSLSSEDPDGMHLICESEVVEVEYVSFCQIYPKTDTLAVLSLFMASTVTLVILGLS